MGLFFKKKKKKEPGVAERLNGTETLYTARRYVDENGNPQEDGIGKGGRINTANGHVILTCGDRDIFVNGDIDSVRCGELMSLNGAIFSGFNEVTGKEDTIVVYYASLFRS